MKLYIASNSENGTENIDGIYYLISEEGECLYSHWCSSKGFAHGDLIGRRENRQEELKEKYGVYEVINLGEDDMTMIRLIELNNKFNKDSKEGVE